MLPVYGILWSIGAYFWAVLYFAAYQFLYGQRRFLVLFVPFIGTVLTLLLATPVASDLRYAYPLILAAPFFIALPYCHLQTSRLQNEMGNVVKLTKKCKIKIRGWHFA